MTVKKSSPFRQGVKSVLNPSAQSAGLCASDFMAKETSLDFIVKDFLNKHEFTPQGALIGLMYSYGLRVSELLSISGRNIMNNGFILVDGSKGSNSRLVVPIYNVEFWNYYKSFNVPLSTYYSRFFLYREMKKFGLYAYFGKNENRSVTHSLRHIKVLNLKSNGIVLSDISKFIGHKSLKSIEFYEKAIRE